MKNAHESRSSTTKLSRRRAEADAAKAAGATPKPSPAVPDALREYRIAASIYDGMIAPLIPFTFAARFGIRVNRMKRGTAV
jgi:hypothetical protein